MKTFHFQSCLNIKMTIMTSYFRIIDDVINFLLISQDFYSLSPGFWQSFVTIRSCNCLLKIVSTYVGNFKEKWDLVNMRFNVSYGRNYVSLQTKSPNDLNSAITEA